MPLRYSHCPETWTFKLHLMMFKTDFDAYPSICSLSLFSRKILFARPRRYTEITVFAAFTRSRRVRLHAVISRIIYYSPYLCALCTYPIITRKFQPIPRRLPLFYFSIIKWYIHQFIVRFVYTSCHRV